MQQETVPKSPPKSHVEIKFRVDVELLEKFDLVRPLQIRSREQQLRLVMRLAVFKGADILAPMPALPEFELLTFAQARDFLSPYYAGMPPSCDTLERRIADGTIIATKESDTRTGRRRILKASLVAWMSRLGKELESEMMP